MNNYRPVYKIFEDSFVGLTHGFSGIDLHNVLFCVTDAPSYLNGFIFTLYYYIFDTGSLTFNTK